MTSWLDNRGRVVARTPSRPGKCRACGKRFEADRLPRGGYQTKCLTCRADELRREFLAGETDG